MKARHVNVGLSACHCSTYLVLVDAVDLALPFYGCFRIKRYLLLGRLLNLRGNELVVLVFWVHDWKGFLDINESFGSEWANMLIKCSLKNPLYDSWLFLYR